MTGMYCVKLKTKKGQHIVENLSATATIGELKQRIAEATLIREPHLNVLIGFPPRPLDISQNDASLADTGIKSGETLIVEEKLNLNNDQPEPQFHQPSLEDDEALARRLQAEEDAQQLLEAQAAAAAGQSPAATLSSGPAPHPGSNEQPTSVDASSSPIQPPAGSSGDFNGILLKKVVPADNSCLFTSIRFVLNGRIDNEGSEMMRHIIAQEVSADPSLYNDAVLGKTNAEYCSWIQRPESWGGAIEVAILSSYYGIEIDVVDVQNAIINRFGEDKNYGLRVFLLFDGIHYDPLYMEPLGGGAPATIFPVEEMGVYHQAEQLASEAKSARQFTNVDKFTLKCLQCDVMLVGQVQAQEHAKSTGHTKFGEI